MKKELSYNKMEKINILIVFPRITLYNANVKYLQEKKLGGKL